MAERLQLYTMFLAVGTTAVFALGGSGVLVVGGPLLAWVGLVSWLG